MSIDRIPLPATPGVLWLCGLRDVAPDPDAVLAWADATTVVCLVRDEEIRHRWPQYHHWIQDHQAARALWFPTPNFSAPDVRTALPMLHMVTERLERGDGVVVHCAFGQGRAGTFAVALLVLLGSTLDEALRTVAAHRVHAGPADESQWALVEGVAAHASSV